MKLLTTIALVLITSTSLFAQTTMCFKENHDSMSTIENTALDGGECKGSLSTNDMQAKGWKVDDIKISTKKGKYSFIYIFKKDSAQSNLALVKNNITEQELENKILKRIEAKTAQKIEEKKIEEKLLNKINGEKIYTSKCQSCHGAQAERRAYNTSRSLINLSIEDMQESIKDYSVGNKDGGYATLMKPYANILTKKKIKAVYAYIQTLKLEKSK